MALRGGGKTVPISIQSKAGENEALRRNDLLPMLVFHGA
jgi:hypothetical protein